MKVLIIGGTIFLGKHLVDVLVKKGHEVTLFNRGKSSKVIPENVNFVQGDREKDLPKLDKLSFDVVIDTCGYVPRVVRQSCNYFKDKIKKYVFISTISVYRDFKIEKIKENYPVGKLENKKTEKIDGNTYGPLKALCEEVVNDTFDNALVIRPGLIVGPNDPTDRFTYWPMIIKNWNEVFVPEDREKSVQFIDVRDLSEFIINLVECEKHGTFNATGPENRISLDDFLEFCREYLNDSVIFNYLKDEQYDEFGVDPDLEIPLWPIDDEKYKYMDDVSIQNALDNGLKFRPLKDTILDTVKWFEGEGRVLKNGLNEEKVKEIIKTVFG